MITFVHACLDMMVTTQQDSKTDLITAGISRKYDKSADKKNETKLSLLFSSPAL